MRNFVLSAVAIAAVLCLAPTAANAASRAPLSNATGTEVDDGYTPNDPQEPMLAATAAGECVRDTPWITFTVSMIDPENQITDDTARLIMADGVSSTSIELGALVDGELSGRVLWPGASVDGVGNATGWPGWAFVDGQWVEVDGNFRWTRGDISATIQVNPDLAVPLSYPSATTPCADPSNPATASLLPATGLGGSMLPIGIGGGVLALGGLILLTLRRRHRANG